MQHLRPATGCAMLLSLFASFFLGQTSVDGGERVTECMKHHKNIIRHNLTDSDIHVALAGQLVQFGQVVPRSGQAGCERMQLTHLVLKLTERHPRPTLLVWGERDNLNPPATVGQKAGQCRSLTDFRESMHSNESEVLRWVHKRPNPLCDGNNIEVGGDGGIYIYIYNMFVSHVKGLINLWYGFGMKP